MNRNEKQVLERLREIDEYEFERFIADLWEKQGWSTEVTQGSNDRGVDIVAKTDDPFPQKHLIQAKRYAEGNKIGSPDIQQYSSLRRQEGDSDAVIVVTTSSFTGQAIDSADILNVKLINGERLFNIILDNDAEDLIDDYLGIDVSSSNGTSGQESVNYDENWAEEVDKTRAKITEEDTEYDVLSRTKDKESSWPQNLNPVSNTTEIRNTLMRCINESMEEEVQGVIKWSASDFEYAVVVEFARQSEWTTDGRIGTKISIEIAKKDRFGEGVDLDISEVSELENRAYQVKTHTGGSFTSVIVSKYAFEDEVKILKELTTIECIIKDVTGQTLHDVNYVSVVDPDQFG